MQVLKNAELVNGITERVDKIFKGKVLDWNELDTVMQSMLITATALLERDLSYISLITILTIGYIDMKRLPESDFAEKFRGMIARMATEVVKLEKEETKNSDNS